jgi:hypothetical protein
VGEAPPASGLFFYKEDSGLYRAIKDAFVKANPSIADGNFLEKFSLFGCYLVDLCGRPVDCLDRRLRARICVAGEKPLSRTIQLLNPEVIITLVRSIEANVRRAEELASWKGERIELPYPGRWHHHRTEFLRILLLRLRSLMNVR